jgi:hypothetical protein
MTTAKILFNSVISTPDGRFMCTDVKDFYLNTLMARYEYMCLPIRILPQEIVEQYQLLPFVHDGWVYVEIRKGMYGLPQAGIITNQRLEKHLAKYGYKPTYLTPGLWRHESRPITFSLAVDDFGVKYVGDQHARLLIKALEDLYTVSSDWTGSLYCCLTLDWDYTNRTVDLSMPNYVAMALHKFQHPPPSCRQHSPHQWTRPVYGARVQYAPEPDDKALLPAADIKRVQQVVGTLLYYARAVDSTMLVALNAISASQSKATKNTAAAIVHLLDYAARLCCHPSRRHPTLPAQRHGAAYTQRCLVPLCARSAQPRGWPSLSQFPSCRSYQSSQSATNQQRQYTCRMQRPSQRHGLCRGS